MSSALPKNPGYDFNYSLGKEAFHKPHHFDNRNDVLMFVGEHKPGIGRELRLGQKPRDPGSYWPGNELSRLPAWIAFDKQVLSFDGYFQESVTERRDEQYRVRHVKIYFYLEDDSLQVVEPRHKNSQLAQGTIIRRHRVPKPAPEEDKYYTVKDLSLGKEVLFYGRRFKITDCDPFTRNFLTKSGFDVGQPRQIPEDPYLNERKATEEAMQPLRPYERRDTLRQFLDHDGHVLRFFAYWDDTKSMFGDEHKLTLHYFLADDTIEIYEQVKVNAGTDTTSCFLRRGKLPKTAQALPQPGKQTDRTVLNVFGELNQNRYILDSLKTGAEHIDYYRDNELTIGSVINVYGRKMLLYDCDDFTKNYYNTKYGVDKFDCINVDRPKPEPVKNEFPPYTGFGTEEDSLTSCQATLQPKPVQKDMKKFLALDRRGSESNQLRFLARLYKAKSIDADRLFVVTYYLMDDTVMIHEPQGRNTGHQGGRFLSRQRMKRPNQEKFSTREPEYYLAQDFYIGAVLQLNQFQLELIDADEYCLCYMEKNKFPYSDIQKIVETLRNLVKDYPQEQLNGLFMAHCQVAMVGDESNEVTINFMQLRGLISEIAPEGTFSNHELLTLARHYGAAPGYEINMHMVSYLAQEDLRRHNYDLFQQRLHEAFLEQDATKEGYLPKLNVLNILKSNHVPLDKILLEQLTDSCCAASQGQLAGQEGTEKVSKIAKTDLVNYQEMLKLFDWKRYPVVVPTQYAKTHNKPLSVLRSELTKQSQSRVLHVSARRLFEDIKPIETIGNN